ncbi:MAG: hypothetical protein IT383_16030 [Deltaproteobacteria bacterium]|nr:hypothetical protein [Deltaproteobacteria bacterium]
MSPLVFQCPACRALVGVTHAQVQGGRAGLSCAACGAVAWLPEATQGSARVVDVEPAPHAAPPRELPAANGALVLAPPTAPMSAAPTTPELALDAELRTRVRHRLAELPAASAAQQELAAAFAMLLEAWNREAAHKAMLQRASGAGELAFVGQHYRAVLEAAPGDPIARRAQDEILSLAMATMTATRDLGALAEDKGAKGKRQALYAAIIAFAFVAVALWAMRERDALLRRDADSAKMLEEPAEAPAR